jgi:hypothetical protein
LRGNTGLEAYISQKRMYANVCFLFSLIIKNRLVAIAFISRKLNYDTVAKVASGNLSFKFQQIPQNSGHNSKDFQLLVRGELGGLKFTSII